ncbi:regulatory protein RecX [Glutamicibacter mysorens]|uniref:Regulatory protein RecX n=3 Tax=Micrococcaceae TaxID=1268 RepID=A0ABX4MX59_9MICC|nr:regulatory protein RecX [Glutamicibacter mysorens]PJJ43335.1 regulatory protein [Glutamicibacter mysorens]UTM47835.1 recombination regulator RecX [Glutamicibacter mysorens]
MASGFQRRSVRPGKNSGSDATSVSKEFQGDLEDMPDWARPSPEELEAQAAGESAKRDRAAQRASQRAAAPAMPAGSTSRTIASFSEQPAKPGSIEELRAAMEQIVAAPAPAKPSKQERREAREARKAARQAGEPEELSDDQWREKARGILLRQLTASDKTAKQLKDKLLENECPEDIADEVIDRYAEINLVDDERFAKSWVVARARSRGLARGAIKRELRTKGVDDELAAEALEQIDDEAEEQRARELVRAKLRPESMGADRDKALRRLVGMLGRKGYNGGMAFKVAREEWEERFGNRY